MPKKGKPSLKIFKSEESLDGERLREDRYRDASRLAIRLGNRDIGVDDRGKIVITDSGPAIPCRADFRSIHDQLNDGDLELLDFAAAAQNYESHSRDFVDYRD